MPEATENKDMITICCTNCGKRFFSFSKNALDVTNGIQFECPHCNATTFVKLNRDEEIEINCVS
jgi:DNA-directed RNA polymerase subunit RPC12/RpoP